MASPRPQSLSDMSDVVEIKGCSAIPCCNPRSLWHRIIVLLFICFLSFGKKYDNPLNLDYVPSIFNYKNVPENVLSQKKDRFKRAQKRKTQVFTSLDSPAKNNKELLTFEKDSPAEDNMEPLTFEKGSYFCFDNPAALQEYISKDMNVSTESYMLLYSLYSWPNVVLCFFGGFLIDRVFGIRLGAILFSLFVLLGQIIFALGALLNFYWMMEAGRFVFGVGGESLAVAQNTYAVSWFKGRELNMVFGLQLSFSRIGSTVNMNVMGPLYKLFQKSYPLNKPYNILGWTLMGGCVFCILSLFSALMMAYFDKRAARLLNKSNANTGEVIRLTDVKDFPLSVWLIFIICVAYYVAVFPFISLGLVYFEAKYDMLDSTATSVNSLIFLISAGASPVLGLYVDKLGYNVFNLIFGILLTLAAHGILAFTFVTPFAAMAIMGVGYSLVACALWPLVAMVVPEYQLGTAYGFMQSIQNLGLAVVSIIAGKIVDTSGYLILEVFFLACLCIALISTVVLYLVDLAKGGALNSSAWARRKPLDIKLEKSESKPLLEDYYTVPPPGTTSTPIVPKSAHALRLKYLSKLGGPALQPPEAFRTSAFVFPHVLK